MHARGAPWGVDGELRRIAQALDACPVLAPLRQALAPLPGLLRGIILNRQPLAAGVIRVHPGQKILRAQVREGEQQVCQVAFGIDEDRRHIINGSFFNEVNAQAGFAASRHAHHHSMGHQVA